MFDLKEELRRAGKADFTCWLEICVEDGDKSLTCEKLHEYNTKNGKHRNQENNKLPSNDCNSCKTKTYSIYRIISEKCITEALDEVIASGPNKVSPSIIEKARILRENPHNGQQVKGE